MSNGDGSLPAAMGAMAFQKVRSARLYEGVVDQIFNLIATGQLEPGHQLPTERALAEQLGVSRNVLREAFRALELRGIVISVPGGGRYIRPDNIQDRVDTRGLIFRLELATVRDILESRELVETQTVVLAAARIDVESARRLRGLAQRLESWEDNCEFHLALAHVTGNLMLPKVVQMHLDLLRDLNQRSHYQDPKSGKSLLEEHVTIAEAVSGHDGLRARDLMARHFQNTRRLLGLE